MNIMITGNMGYVGPAVVSHIRQQLDDCTIIGVDTGLFGHCLTEPCLPEHLVDVQIFSDVRDLTPDLFSGIDAVIHLAAISNDPMGVRFEKVTDEINHRATLRTAELAAESGVGRFVFASSCSMYGYAEAGARRETDPLNPLTAYARSKVAAEAGLRDISTRTNMIITALRFSTACGFSGRMRLDLVLNDFVASALSTGRVSVLSDGSPWRPLIHVRDMARAIEWALQRAEHDGFLAINVGCEEWNYQVRELAEAVKAAMPGVDVDINANAPPDKRSYRVNFDLFRSLAPDHQPRMTLPAAVADIHDGLMVSGFKDANYRSSDLVRLNVLTRGIESGLLDDDVRWLDRRSVLPRDQLSLPLRREA
ncbi:NAD-dependent epimerase/dehydratase family protein [Rhizobium leucaenae]|uniref:Nucleoside-diphosphate-sugar epimerase n=1 Tax=Rhizobium leucaenae TaxID=29450 RepID=A0A7W6ZZC5_9HYPH|nr:SDR family oxidoreductase [Rhizobium leucaenae]MBB4571506.1 nucleoside-diphosphate-sugar epimerase [Rhizobium leucaenae]MBB6304828.1 nucleoside-diphosphate-sugar epimerase [Rhizobium leucaenae]